MSVKVGSARIDENGKAYGGKAGDQTGREVSTQDWYLHAKGWVILRARDPEMREKIAQCMQAACDNPHIGYDQYQRDTLYNEAKQFGFDVSLVTKDVECDCSSLVRVCCAYAGILVNSFRTPTEASVLMATGQFDKYTDDRHCRKSTNLLRGDILVTRTQGHTVIVLSDGSNAGEETGDLHLGDRILRKGDAGPDVKELQEALLSLGYSLARYGADGDFGAVTEKAVRAFQTKVRLTTDGIYGPKTHVTLQDALEPKVTVTQNTEIRAGNGLQYAVVGEAKIGDTFLKVAEAANSWTAIVLDDQVGWVSNQTIE